MAAGAGFFFGAIVTTALVLVGHTLVPTVRADFVHVDVDLAPPGTGAGAAVASFSTLDDVAATRCNRLRTSA